MCSQAEIGMNLINKKNFNIKSTLLQNLIFFSVRRTNFS